MSATAVRELLAIELEPLHPSEYLDDDALLERAARQVQALQRAVEATRIHSLSAYAVITDGGLSLGEIADQMRVRLEVWELALACPDDRPPLPPELWMLARPKPGTRWQDFQAIAREATIAWWGRSLSIIGVLVRCADSAPLLDAPSMAPVQRRALQMLEAMQPTEAEAAAWRRAGVGR